MRRVEVPVIYGSFWRNCPRCLWFSWGRWEVGVHIPLPLPHTQRRGRREGGGPGLSCLASALFSRRPLRASSSDSAVRFFPTACLALPSPCPAGSTSPALARPGPWLHEARGSRGGGGGGGEARAGGAAVAAAVVVATAVVRLKSNWSREPSSRQGKKRFGNRNGP